MLICRFYTQPVSTQAGADGDDKEDDENTNCDNVYRNSEKSSNRILQRPHHEIALWIGPF